MSADKDAWIGGVESAVIQQAVNATAYTRLTDLLLAGRVDVCYNLFIYPFSFRLSNIQKFRHVDYCNYRILSNRTVMCRFPKHLKRKLFL
jgi:hypothetical protein